MVLIFISLMVSGVENFFICIYIGHMYVFFEELSILILCLFLIGLFIFFFGASNFSHHIVGVVPSHSTSSMWLLLYILSHRNCVQQVFRWFSVIVVLYPLMFLCDFISDKQATSVEDTNIRCPGVNVEHPDQ